MISLYIGILISIFLAWIGVSIGYIIRFSKKMNDPNVSDNVQSYKHYIIMLAIGLYVPVYFLTRLFYDMYTKKIKY
jgi:ABC-type dipeptide/oligopeptide/nickel transport system permease subunit